ncbi:MAG: 3-hydroxylacyl-ACP dehydratase [Rhodocyclaceae bacterium]|nr:3-hydroxylacyl-ACP dehydratase [Rhodocyclaceae bacterium]
MIRDRAWLAAHLPHHGAMCLLDAVEHCDPQRIVCTATSHARSDNPLRRDRRLGIAIGVEYAAQAMAAHGAMLGGGERPRVGYVASVRSLELFATRLDREAALQVVAERLSGDDATVLYRFEVGAAGECLLRGRATVVLRAGAAR